MSPEPDVKPLPYGHRLWFFRGLLFLFVCAVPVFMFYATGYRLSFTETRNIISVGGIFISAETEDTAIFLNGEPVENYRLFQRAAYIQNLPAGVHRLHVQGEGLHTWVKELPVYPHIVTEATAFNYPVVPQVRLITSYETTGGTPFVAVASETPLVSEPVTYQMPVLASSTLATSTLVVNEEYAFVTELFASSSTTTQPSAVRTRLQAQIEDVFVFSSERPTSTATSTRARATTTRERSDRRLFETASGIAVSWVGDPNNHPYYFCINTTAPPTATSSALSLYVANNVASVADSLQTVETRGDFACRDTIPLTTFGRTVLLFDFMPDSSDRALVQLSDGLYAIEFDDRGWQNTQLLYPGEEIEVVVQNEQIFINDDDYFFELLLTLSE
jgi:hypothetical protein